MLSCVVIGAAGFFEWLDALYIISYIRIVTVTLQYAPQVGFIDVSMFGVYMGGICPPPPRHSHKCCDRAIGQS